MPQTSKNAAETAREASDRTERTTRRNLQLVDKAGEAAGQVGLVAARSSAEGSARLGRAFSDLMAEQTHYNIKAMHELAAAVDWQEVARIHGEFLRATLERTALLSQRYLQLASR
ncbi:MAG: hypothetical protein HC869_10590 [Rhodospirillales bacterium]|nr:hypothetical protein [Rhodospirillales bacterium]